jgi:type II secretory pathway pseudopilin PulG
MSSKSKCDNLPSLIVAAVVVVVVVAVVASVTGSLFARKQRKQKQRRQAAARAQQARRNAARRRQAAVRQKAGREDLAEGVPPGRPKQVTGAPQAGVPWACGLAENAGDAACTDTEHNTIPPRKDGINSYTPQGPPRKLAGAQAFERFPSGEDPVSRVNQQPAYPQPSEQYPSACASEYEWICAQEAKYEDRPSGLCENTAWGRGQRAQECRIEHMGGLDRKRYVGADDADLPHEQRRKIAQSLPNCSQGDCCVAVGAPEIRRRGVGEQPLAPYIPSQEVRPLPWRHRVRDSQRWGDRVAAAGAAAGAQPFGRVSKKKVSKAERVADECEDCVDWLCEKEAVTAARNSRPLTFDQDRDIALCAPGETGEITRENACNMRTGSHRTPTLPNPFDLTPQEKARIPSKIKAAHLERRPLVGEAAGPALDPAAVRAKYARKNHPEAEAFIRSQRSVRVQRNDGTCDPGIAQAPPPGIAEEAPTGEEDREGFAAAYSPFPGQEINAAAKESGAEPNSDPDCLGALGSTCTEQRPCGTDNVVCSLSTAGLAVRETFQWVVPSTGEVFTLDVNDPSTWQQGQLSEAAIRAGVGNYDPPLDLSTGGTFLSAAGETSWVVYEDIPFDDGNDMAFYRAPGVELSNGTLAEVQRSNTRKRWDQMTAQEQRTWNKIKVFGRPTTNVGTCTPQGGINFGGTRTDYEYATQAGTETRSVVVGAAPLDSTNECARTATPDVGCPIGGPGSGTHGRINGFSAAMTRDCKPPRSGGWKRRMDGTTVAEGATIYRVPNNRFAAGSVDPTEERRFRVVGTSTESFTEAGGVTINPMERLAAPPPRAQPRRRR